MKKLIEDLQLEITKKDEKINELKKIKEYLNKITKAKIDENNLFKKYNNFSSEEKLISIKFISDEQNIDYSLPIKNTEKFDKIEAMLYDKYPNYIKPDDYFVVKDKRKINKDKTLIENNIENNDEITF